MGIKDWKLRSGIGIEMVIGIEIGIGLELGTQIENNILGSNMFI